jgi:CheY-like chemotaxis protein
MPNAKHNPNGCSVFIVEDEAIISMDLETRLLLMGYDVIGSASSGEETLRFLEVTQPELILMDVNLGKGMDGVALSQMIRAKYDLPCLFVTAYNDDSTIARATLSSPLGYLSKPFSDRELKAAIEIGIFKDKKEKELRRERDELLRMNQVLRKSRETINQLQSLIPVCGWCKSIRTDDGYWEGVNNFVAKLTGQKVSTTICKRCAIAHFRDTK